MPKDLTIRELQTQLPWTVHYHHDFRASPVAHKDFAHALLHVFKAAGKLASVVNDAEHGGSDFKHEEVDRFVADLVVCALRMANTCPGRTIDLQRAVEDRIQTKNEAELRREPQ
jgi:phospholipid N-methyltransferase